MTRANTYVATMEVSTTRANIYVATVEVSMTRATALALLDS
jgi:hypothetical protein